MSVLHAKSKTITITEDMRLAAVAYKLYVASPWPTSARRSHDAFLPQRGEAPNERTDRDLSSRGGYLYWGDQGTKQVITTQCDEAAIWRNHSGGSNPTCTREDFLEGMTFKLRSKDTGDAEVGREKVL